MATSPQQKPREPQRQTDLIATVSLIFSFVLGTLSIGTLIYYLIGKGRRTDKVPTKPEPEAMVTTQVIPTLAPIVSNVGNKRESDLPAITKPSVAVTNPQKVEREARPRPAPQVQTRHSPYFVTIIVLSLSFLLLGFAELILNLADWFKLDLKVLAPLQDLSCMVPGFCTLNFPPLALPAFIAIAIAAILFGWYLARLGWPIVSEIETQSVGPLNFRRLLFWPLTVTAGVFLICQGIVITQAILGVLVEPTIWFVGLVTGWVLIWQMSRSSEGARRATTLWNVGYVVGIFFLCLTVAAISAQHWVVAVIVSLLTVLLLGGDFYTHWREWSTADRAERLGLVGLTLVSFGMLSYGLNSWNWSILGDEYSFYDLANQFAHGQIYPTLLSGAGVYGYHPVLSSAWQGTSMALLGSDGYGWRVSHSLLLAISVPLFYYFMRPLIGRGSAFGAAALYGSAHVLLSFGKLGSNNGQVIVVMALSWAIFVWASRRGSLPAFALTGIVVGLGFYTFGIARVYSLLIAIWLALYYFPLGWRPLRIRWDNVRIWVCLIGMALLTALPVLSTREAWAGQLRQSLFNSEIAFTPYDVFLQFLRNTLYSLLSFVYNNQNAVFVYGTLADPITAGLMVLGLATLLATWRHGWRIRLGLLATYLLYVAVIGGMQQYSYPSITRMFSVAPFYALFAAIGLAAVYKLLTKGEAPGKRSQWMVGIGLGVLVGGAMVLNNWISVDLSPQRVEQKLPAFELQTAQLTGDANGNGPHIYLVAPPEDEFWMNKIYTVHDIPTTRYTHIYPRDALLDDTLCQAGQQPAVLIIPASTTDGGYIADQIHQCWADSQVRQIKDGRGDLALYRVMNPGAIAKVHSLPGYWVEEAPPTAQLTTDTPNYDIWQAYQPRGLAVAPNGNVAVVEASTESILFFDSDGKIQSVLKGIFTYPSAPAYLSNGNLVVADAGVGVFIFDAKDAVRLQITSLASPRGVFITPDDTIYVAEAGAGKISVFNDKAELLKSFPGGDDFPQPTTVAVSADGLIAIGDPVVGKITVIDQKQKVLNQFTINTGDSSDAKPGLLWLPNGNLLYTDAAAGVMRLVDPKGKLVKEWTNLQRPNSLALGPGGIIYVLEAGANHVIQIPVP